MKDEAFDYTVIPLENPEHREKLASYMKEHPKASKTSYCRFWLRGLCIMRSEHCKFAHDFDELDLQDDSYKRLAIMDCNVNEKSERKKLFILNTDFNQRPLFLIKNLDFYWLYHFQFTPRYQQAGIPPLGLKEIRGNNEVRRRIREVMHREQWDKFVDFIERTFPGVDYTISMLSNWFAKLGFEKAQTRCKFGDFMRYLNNVRGYYEANLVVPPLLTRSVYYLHGADTYLQANIELVKADHEVYLKELRAKKELRTKKLPEDLHKRFVCRFYMAGNCEQSREECPYVHCMADLRYDSGVDFEKQHRQPPKSKEDRLNYVSLHHYYARTKSQDQPEVSLEDLNMKFELKDALRKDMHREIYGQFLGRLHEWEGADRVLPVRVVRQCYTRCGFNHTDENKFGQLMGVLWDLGYHEDETTIDGEKHQYIVKVPPQHEMDALFDARIGEILKQQTSYGQGEKGEVEQVLESSVRRLVYARTNKLTFDVPLHVYLRRKKATFKQILETRFAQYCPFVFFESGTQTYKKMQEHLKKYLKKHRAFLRPWEHIDSHIKGLGKDVLNLNCLNNYRHLLELALLELGKEVYFWPMANATLVLDRTQAPPEPVTVPAPAIEVAGRERLGKMWEEKIVMVDGPQSVDFCLELMRSCFIYGVDLEGRLSQDGCIDLIQVSCPNEGNHILIIDVFWLKKNGPKLYEKMRLELKELFEDESRIKVMHGCQQDSVALHYLMGITMRGVFDTSGMETYFSQREKYHHMRHHNQTSEHTLKSLRIIKCPGLNTVLTHWQATHGPNQLKNHMKEVFEKEDRAYFEARPLPEDFLTYSARDVQDLIEVYHKMTAADPEGVWRVVGQMYVENLIV